MLLNLIWRSAACCTFHGEAVEQLWIFRGLPV